MQPLPLAANTVASFYRGAGRIAGFRGDDTVDPTHPEDWLAATTSRFGSDDLGLTRLGDGTLLRDAFVADPEAWFGPDYLARYGAAGALLGKLLDCGNRLPLHVHPTRDFARAHLASPFGKSEAWLVLHAEEDASAHLGFNRAVSDRELTQWVRAQDITALLSNCNLVPIETGDVIFCPGGVPHSIGAGVLILEIQEMTDFSIMLEWAGFPLDPDAAFLGLERDTALGAVRRDPVAGEDLDALQGRTIATLATGRPGVKALLPPGAAEFFAAEQVISAEDRPAALDARFAIVVVNEGAGELVSNESSTPVVAGQILLVPYSAGPLELHGRLSAVRCYPS